uniref:Integrase catalytic domain-containing protein n=1 Tax=Amphimedon queenslandica TaxID=400682 RepID=A0A1X7U8S6_AMPQE
LVGYHIGVPSTVTTNRGSQFKSSFVAQLTRLLGIVKCGTTAYHSQANGMIERFHCQLKAAFLRVLRLRCSTEYALHQLDILIFLTHSLPLHTLFIRRDLVKRPLQCPYDELYKVLERTVKYYVIDINVT